jgi:hypothetical protein
MKPELVANYIAGISAVVAIISLLFTGIALRIAKKSAAAAQSSANIAKQVLHRSALRDLVNSCGEVLSEEQRIRSIADDLRGANADLFLFSGSIGGDRDRVYCYQINDSLARASDLAAEAATLHLDSTQLTNSSDDDLDSMFFRVEKARIAIRSIREKLSGDLDGVRAQNQLFREKRMS